MKGNLPTTRFVGSRGSSSGTSIHTKSLGPESSRVVMIISGFGVYHATGLEIASFTGSHLLIYKLRNHWKLDEAKHISVSVLHPLGCHFRDTLRDGADILCTRLLQVRHVFHLSSLALLRNQPVYVLDSSRSMGHHPFCRLTAITKSSAPEQMELHGARFKAI